MNLFNRQKDDTPIVPVAPVTAQTPPSSLDEGSRIDWRRAGPRIAGLAILLVLIVLGILWAVGAFDNNEPKKTTKQESSSSQSAKEQSDKQKSDNNSSSSSDSSTANGSSSASGTSPSPATPPPASSATGAAANGQLANTGPGETAAVVIVAAAGSTLVYQVMLRRRNIRS